MTMIKSLFYILPILSLTPGEFDTESPAEPQQEVTVETPVTESRIAEEPSACINTNTQEKGVLKGIVLMPSPSFVKRDPEANGVTSDDFIIPGGSSNLTYALRAYFNLPINKGLIIAIRDDLLSYFKAHGLPMIVIEVPPQDITTGVLQIVVYESRVDQVKITGARYYPESQIAQMIRQHPGDVVNSNILLKDIDWINRSPYRHADLIMEPGGKENTTNLEVRISDKFPLRVYAGVDNTGNRATGHNRLFGGFSWANVFHLDHTFSYQGTVSSNFDQFVSHTLNYVAPLSYRHVLMFYGGYAQVKPEIEGFHSRGTSTQVSGRYQIPFGNFENSVLQEFTVGADYKNTNNNLILLSAGEIPIITSHVEYVQFMTGYSFGKQTGKHTISLNLQAFGSPGSALGDSSNEKFSDLRLGAKNFYLYGRFAGSYTYTGETLTFYCMERMQFATNPLLPPEQYGVGGYDTVRGYREREVNADDTVIVNLELRSPKTELFSMLWKSKKKYRDELMVYGFVDYAYTNELKTMPGEDKRQQLCSIGPGLKYNFEPFFSMRIDWGIRLRNSQFEDAWGSKVHFGLIASY